MFDLKKFRKDFNLTQGDLQPILNVTQGFISKVENGRELFPSAYIDRLKSKFGDDVDNYISDTGKADSNALQFDNYRLIPLYSTDVVGGHVNQECDTNGYITGYIPFVNAKEGDIAVPVTNDSMYPVYAPGCMVQVRKIEAWREYIEFGQVHIIELHDDRRLIKTVRKGSDKNHLILESENPKYDPTEINIEYIRSVWLVIAKYQKNVM